MREMGTPRYPREQSFLNDHSVMKFTDIHQLFKDMLLLKGWRAEMKISCITPIIKDPRLMPRWV